MWREENGYRNRFPVGSCHDGEWKEWFDANILFSYFESDYPWTRLGYTYDWGGTQEYGLTEFLVRDPSKTEIAFTYTTAEFVEYLKIGRPVPQPTGF